MCNLLLIHNIRWFKTFSQVLFIQVVPVPSTAQVFLPSGQVRSHVGAPAPITHSLTEQRVWETVPPAPVGPGQPPASDAGREAEGGPEEADQHVAGADVDQQQVRGSLQAAEPGEHEEHEEVTDEAQNQDQPEDHGRRGVTRPAQRAGGGVRHGAVPGAEVVAMLQEDHHGNRVTTVGWLSVSEGGGEWV